MCLPIAAAGLVLSAVSTVASVGMGMYQASQASAAAQAQMNTARQQQQMQMAQANTNAMMQQRQMWQQNMLSISQQGQQQSMQMRMQMAQMAQQSQMQAQQQNLQINLQRQSLQLSQQMQREQQMFQAMQLGQQQALQRELQYQQLSLQQKQYEDQRALQVAQANAEIANKYQAERQAALNERNLAMARNMAERLQYQKSLEGAQAQARENNNAANRAFLQEQVKLAEIRKKASFEMQTEMAKAIGTKGTILASGRTGQSIGLLINDVERQKGFAIAQQRATLESAFNAAALNMQQAEQQNRSANNQAFNQVGMFPTDPTLPKLPERPTFVDGIGAAYNPSQFR